MSTVVDLRGRHFLRLADYVKQLQPRLAKAGLTIVDTPRILLEANSNPDKAAARRAFEAMMTMKKIDIAKIETALKGESVNA